MQRIAAEKAAAERAAAEAEEAKKQKELQRKRLREQRKRVRDLGKQHVTSTELDEICARLDMIDLQKIADALETGDKTLLLETVFSFQL